jgi:hypothetical protein
MAEDVTCSLGDCGEQVVGIGIILADVRGETDWEKGGYTTYGDKVKFVILHPMCFLRLFDEIIRQQLSTALNFYVSTSGDIHAILKGED